MEVLGVAASVTGILCFTGEAVRSLMTLQSFIRAIKVAPQRVANTLSQLDTLNRILTEITSLAQRLKEHQEEWDSLKSGIRGLEEAVQSCFTDVQAWKNEFGNVRLGNDNAVKTFLKKVKFAADKDKLGELQRKMDSQRQSLNLALSLCGRELDQAGLKQNQVVAGKVDNLTTSVVTGFSDVGTKVDKLFALGTNSCDSMESIAESISRLEIAWTDGMKPKMALLHDIDSHPWGCDAITGIDDAFSCDPVKGMSRCIFCRKVFVWEDLESSARLGRHLVDRHAFGKCNLNMAYKTWEEFEEHLVHFHDRTPGLKKDLFLRKVLPDASVLLLDDSQCQPSQGLAPDEVTARSLLLTTVLESKLQTFGIEFLVGRDANSEHKSHFICSALARLERLCRESNRFHGASLLQNTQRFQALYQAACIEEEITLSGDLDTLRFGSLYSAEQNDLDRHWPSTLRLGDVLLPGDAQTGWYCDVGKLKKYKFPSDCEDCLSNKRYVLRKHALVHIIMLHQREPDPYRPMLGALDVAAKVIVRQPDETPKTFLSSINAERLGSLPSDDATFTMLNIDTWLLKSFLESFSFRRLLQSGQAINVTDPYHCPPGWCEEIVLRRRLGVGDRPVDIECIGRGSDDLSSKGLHKYQWWGEIKPAAQVCKSTRSDSHYDGSVGDAVFQDD